MGRNKLLFDWDVNGSKQVPHPVDETLHEPLGAVNPCRHLLSVLQRETQSVHVPEKHLHIILQCCCLTLILSYATLA